MDFRDAERGVLISVVRVTAFCLFGLLLSLPSIATEAGETVSEVPLCQLLGDPGAYNHKLIRVTGRVSRGFEDFSLHDPYCPKAKS